MTLGPIKIGLELHEYEHAHPYLESNMLCIFITTTVSQKNANLADVAGSDY